MRHTFIFIVSLFVTLKVYGDTNAGKNIYNTKCLMCHGSSGKGDGPVGSNLSKKLQPLKQISEKQIIDILKAGQKGLMPDFSGLSVTEKQDVAKYIIEVLLKN